LIITIFFYSPFWLGPARARSGLFAFASYETLFAFTAIIIFSASIAYLAFLFLPVKNLNFYFSLRELFFISIVCIFGFTFISYFWHLIGLENLEIVIIILFAIFIIISPIILGISKQKLSHKSVIESENHGKTTFLIYTILLLIFLIIVSVYLTFITVHSTAGRNMSGLLGIILFIIIPVHSLGIFVFTRLSQNIGINKRIVNFRTLLSLILFFLFPINLFTLWTGT